MSTCHAYFHATMQTIIKQVIHKPRPEVANIRKQIPAEFANQFYVGRQKPWA